MIRNHAIFLAFGLLAVLIFDSYPSAVYARPLNSVLPQSGSDLLAAVNALRVSHGLPPYSANPILMQIAQNQADYLAATGGAPGHVGPGGTRPIDRAAAAGYPVGSFFSENWWSGAGLSPAGAVSAWQGDAPHLHTMLSPDLVEAGAGVSKAGGVVYYVLDAGAPAGSNGNSGGTGNNPVVTPGTPQPSQFIVPVVTSTPRSDGLVYHEVAYGQTLWSIAIAYGTTIENIKQLNNLSSIDIYLGQKLLIRKGPTPMPSTPTAAVTLTSMPLTATSTLTFTPAVSGTVTVSAAPTSEGEPPSQPAQGLNLTAILIIGGALLFAALGTWLGTRKPV